MQPIHRSAPPRRIRRLPAVIEIAGVHASTIYRWEQAGLFPKRIALGPNSVGWYADEVDAWVANRQRQTDIARPSPNPRAKKHSAAEQDDQVEYNDIDRNANVEQGDDVEEDGEDGEVDHDNEVRR